MPDSVAQRRRDQRVRRIASRSFGFVHINKCAGRSVEAALGLPKFHGDARRMIRVFGREAWDGMFTFAVVRNPYTRLASLYHYRRRKGRLGGPDIAFADWLEGVFAAGGPRYAHSPAMLRPCHDWLIDGQGRIAVREVVHLEELPTRWPALCARLGSDTPLPHRNAGDGTRDCVRLYPPSLRTLVEDVFAADFEAFGYGFPGGGR